MAESAFPTGPANPSIGADNGPALSAGEFDTMFDRLRRWGKGIDADERGSVAALNDAQRLAALATVRTGRSISLAHPIDKQVGPDNNRPALHHMVDLGDVEPPEPSAHKDFIGLDYRNHSLTRGGLPRVSEDRVAESVEDVVLVFS